MLYALFLSQMQNFSICILLQNCFAPSCLTPDIWMLNFKAKMSTHIGMRFNFGCRNDALCFVFLTNAKFHCLHIATKLFCPELFENLT